jgi:hypothetical protein
MPAVFEWPLHEKGNHQLLTSEQPGKRAEYTITSYAQYRSFFGGKSLLNFALNTSSSDKPNWLIEPGAKVSLSPEIA